LPLLVGVPAAQAQISQVCGNTASGYCINAWNGGPSVKMYYGGYSNDNFGATPSATSGEVPNPLVGRFGKWLVLLHRWPAEYGDPPVQTTHLHCRYCAGRRGACRLAARGDYPVLADFAVDRRPGDS
jgi:hypothetical protein